MQLPKAEDVPALAALRRARARQLEAAASSVVEALRPDDAPSALALPPALDLAFENLVYRLPSGRPLLRGVTGRFAAGGFHGIYGPSGAGKTTLLLALAGKLRLDEGTVRFNGRAVDPRAHRALLGFVPEQDIVLPTLTVIESLRFAARLKLPPDLPAAAREAEVELTLRRLGLERVRDSLVGDGEQRGVSFGERRRLNIAIELVGAPAVLFVDDATAGLDSTTAQQVMSCLQRVAQSGVAVAAILHQPSRPLHRMLDSVLLLAAGGRVVFEGAADDAADHFGGFGLVCPRFANPAEWMLELVTEPAPDEFDGTAENVGDEDGGAAGELAPLVDSCRRRPSSRAANDGDGDAEAALLVARTGGGGGHWSSRVRDFLSGSDGGDHSGGGGGGGGGGKLGGAMLSVEDSERFMAAASAEPSALVAAWAARAMASASDVRSQPLRDEVARRQLLDLLPSAAPPAAASAFEAAIGAETLPKPSPPPAAAQPLPPPRPPPSFVALFRLFCGRALVQAWRARAWALVETALFCACVTLVCLVHYDSGYIGPVARPYREQCRGRVRAYARDERYAYMVEPALAMCDGALRDALPVVWAQMGEALMFCAMAAALQTYGRELAVFKREASSRRGVVAYALAKEVAALPSALLAPLPATFVLVAMLPLRIDAAAAYASLALLMWNAAAVGHVASILLDKVRASVVGCMVLMAWVTTNGLGPTRVKWQAWGLAPLPALSPHRWYCELMYTSTAARYADEWDTSVGLAAWGYAADGAPRAARWLLAVGAGWRLLTVAALLAAHEPGACVRKLK